MFRWNHEKNRLLISERGISFEEITQAIFDGHAVNDSPHKNKEKYPNQRILTVMINNYAYLVPYVIDGNDLFLKTIIPNRQATKEYREE